MATWPRDTEAALIKFYGTPGREVELQLVPVVPPFKMYYGTKQVSHLMLHRKCAPAFARALKTIWDYYQYDQAAIDRLRISSTAGTYNPRKIAGTNRWSNHAFGCALDLDAAHNGFNTGMGTMPLPVVAAFKAEGLRWGGEYKGRTDPMHFEACQNGEPERTFAQWIDHYGQPQSGQTQIARADTDIPVNGIATSDATPNQPHKTIVTARTVAASAAGVVAAGSSVKTVIGPTSETAEQIKEVVAKSGEVIALTKETVAVPKPGFLNGVVHFVTSPEFVTSAVLLIALAWVLVWWLQRRSQAGPP